MANLMQRGAAWWTSQVMQFASREVTYRDYRGPRKIQAATSQLKKETINTRRGRLLRLQRTIRIQTSDVPDPKVQVDMVTIGNRTYTVMDWNPVGDSYAKLLVETESVMASERENYRDF